jgi:hypothetical protein
MRLADNRLMGRRLDGIPGFGIDRVAEAAGSDPEVLRLERLTDARLGAHDWKPGDRIPRRRDTLEAVEVRAGHEDELETLVVRPA